MLLKFYLQVLNFDFINKFRYKNLKKSIKMEKIRIKIYFNILTFKKLLIKSLFIKFFLLNNKNLIKISKFGFIIKSFLTLRQLKIPSPIFLLKNNFSRYIKKKIKSIDYDQINIELIYKSFRKNQLHFLTRTTLKFR